jgi:hypothetical protein
MGNKGLSQTHNLYVDTYFPEYAGMNEKGCGFILFKKYQPKVYIS